SDGKALKTFLAANPNATVTVDPAYAAADNPQVNTVAAYSSRGPSVGNFAATRDFALKPELVAPGTNVYTATQKFDPNSDTYNATGYTTVNGTSYAVPFVAGVAAMAKAQNPNLNTAGRLKSAVVNTATADLLGGPHVTDAGAGKLNAADAVNVAATLEPAAISFGPVPTVMPVNRTLTLTNVSAAAATLSITVRQLSSDSNARVTVTPSSVTLPAGQSSQPITVSLTGSRPAAGAYEGFLDVKGAEPNLHLPYFYVVGNGVPYDMFALQDGSFTGIPNDFGWLLTFRLLDAYGVPVPNTPVSFQILAGGGKFDAQGGDKTTDALGGAGKSLPGHFHFISPGQINVQIPWEFQGQSSVQMKVTLYGYLWGALYTVPLATYSPGIFAVTDGVSNAVISAANPAIRGGSIVIYANGLGPVDAAQSSGDPASATALTRTNMAPTVTLGGSPATLLFSGLTPGSVGLYQVNVAVASGAPSGTPPLKLSIGGQDATVNVVVQ